MIEEDSAGSRDDLKNQTITWANAGHQPPLIRDNKGEFIEYSDAGIPVGVIKQESSDITP